MKIEDLSRPALFQMAAELGAAVTSRMKKQDLISAIRKKEEAGGAIPGPAKPAIPLTTFSDAVAERAAKKAKRPKVTDVPPVALALDATPVKPEPVKPEPARPDVVELGRPKWVCVDRRNDGRVATHRVVGREHITLCTLCAADLELRQERVVEGAWRIEMLPV